MRLKNKLVAFTAGVIITSDNAYSALVIEFNEVEGEIIMSFTGQVNLGASFEEDFTVFSGLVDRLGTEGLSPGGSGTSSELVCEIFEGEDLLIDALFGINSLRSLSPSIGLGVNGDSVTVYDNLATVFDNNLSDISVLSAEAGGELEGVSQRFTGSFSFAFGDAFPKDTLIDLWRVSGTTSSNNLIQFRLNSNVGGVTSDFNFSLEIERISNEGEFRLQWNTEEGESYHVEFSDDLSEWVRLTSNAIEPGVSQSAEFIHTPEVERGFYRVALQE